MNHYTQAQRTLGSPIAGLHTKDTLATPTASEELKCLEEALDALDTNLKELDSKLSPIRLSYTRADGSTECPEPAVSSFTSDIRTLKKRVIVTALWVNDLTNQINL